MEKETKIYRMELEKSLKFMLDTNRNLLLTATASFSAMVFAAAADALNFRNQPNVTVNGVMSSVTSGVMFVFVATIAAIHAYMVYRHAKVIRTISHIWFLIPIGIVLVVYIPIIVYLILLYT